MTSSGDEVAYQTLADIVLEAAQIFQPPERLSVADAAEKYRYLHNPPAYIGEWKNSTTPYMIEPMNVFASRKFTGLCFVGPAQSAKTDALVLNTLTYTVMCNPADFILYQTSQASARDFSKRRIDRLHRHSKFVGAQMMPGQHSDNTFDKFYKSGMMFTMSWPSINEMSGRPVPLVVLTDYDRMPMDIDGEGSPFDLAQKRATTFKSFGMTVVESSPGFEVSEPKWKPSTPNEAPPCEGILSIYNRGDRRRFNWPCPVCGEYFEGAFSMLKWEQHADPTMAAKTVYMIHPKNGCYIRPDQRHEMNQRGVWLREGEKIDKNGVVSGNPVISDMASFWLKGVAASFITWQTLVTKFLNAEQEFKRTGSQDALKATVNTDQGEPYVPRGLDSERDAVSLAENAVGLQKHKVPTNVRALIATIDVQKNRWEVQVHGIAPGYPYDLVLIDRFPIVKSLRLDDDGERHWVKPSAYPEDWDLLETEVLDKTYELMDGSGRMEIALTLCDSGGKEGVTTNAYDFYRKLKKKNKHHRFMLLKGDNKPNAPRAHVTFPDTARKDRFANARGEIPVLMLNTNALKDTLNGMLETTEDFGAAPEEAEKFAGRITFPDWLGEENTPQQNFFEELTVEIRTTKGWENPHGRRNESWDLLTYCIGACVFRRVETVDWTDPPKWLSEWGENSLVERTAAAPANQIDKRKTTGYGLAALGEALG